MSAGLVNVNGVITYLSQSLLTPVNVGAIAYDNTGDRGQVPFGKVQAALVYLNSLGLYLGMYGILDATGGTDHTALIQSAVNDAIVFKVPLRIPPGIFQVSTIFCYRTSQAAGGYKAQDNLTIIGAGGNYKSNDTVTNYSASTTFLSNSTTNPVFAIDGCRGTFFRDFAIRGKNTAPAINIQNNGNLLTDTQSLWVGTCRNAQNSPYCAIALDAFNSAIPIDSATGANTGGINGYPGLGAYYAGSTIDGSAGLQFENIHIAQFVVGIGIGLSGVGSQTDTINFNNVFIQYADTGIAVGHAQAKAVTFLECTTFTCRNGFDGLFYGTPTTGCPPAFIRHHFEICWRLFSSASGFGNLSLIACYAESVAVMGLFGTGFSTIRSALHFDGGDFAFEVTGQALGYVSPPVILETWAVTAVRGVMIRAAGNNITPPVLNLLGMAQPIEFDACGFPGSAVANYPPFLGFPTITNQTYPPRIRDSWFASVGGPFLYSDITARLGSLATSSPGGQLIATHQLQRVLAGVQEYIYTPANADPYFRVQGCSAWNIASTTLTYTTTNAAQVQVGDIQYWIILKQGASGTALSVPAWQVTSVVGANVTCTALFDINQYDTVARYNSQISGNSMYTCVNEWAPAVALTCTTTTGLATITLVSPTTVLGNGDWVIGSGIANGSRVASGGGTANITLSQPINGAGAANVTLFHGRLNIPTTTVAF